MQDRAVHLRIDERDAGTVVKKALLNAANRLKISNILLGKIIGVSPTKITRFEKDEAKLQKGKKDYELALLFIRMYRSLDSITGGDDNTSKSWLRNPNKALGAKPIEMIETVQGLVSVINYLDSRRAVA